MNNLTQIRYAAKNYNSLQGLRIVPIAFAGFLMGLAGLIGSENQLVSLLYHAGLPVSLLISFMIGTQYNRKYGVAQRSRRSKIQNGLGGAAGFMIYSTLRESGTLEHAAVSLLALVAAGMTLYIYFQSEGLRNYLLGVTVLYIPLIIGPLFGWNILELANGGSLILFVFGAIALMAGVLDHLTLVKLMSPQSPQQ